MKIEKNKEYQWSPNFRHPIAHVSINRIIEELETIEECFGSISAEKIIESAKNKNSCLHSYFQWDDEIAAHKFRLQQATKLLARIEVKTIKNGDPIYIKAFEITASKSPTYSKIGDLSDKQIDTIGKIVSGDINAAIKRLSPYPQYEKAIPYLKMAIQVIEKSTETKEVAAPLVAVS